MNKRNNKKSFNGKKDKTECKDTKFKGSRLKDANPRKGESANDPNWYTVNSELAKQVANVPFSQFIGVDYQMMASAVIDDTGNATIANIGAKNGTIPSVMMSTYVPWYGKATAASDALAITTRAFYQFIRHANSGAKNYEAPDLMMYIMAMDNIYLAVGEIKRVLRLANTYYLKNRTIPDAILSTMYLDSIDLRKNYISYVARLNILISRINTMAVPLDFNLFNRRAVMSSAIMTDDVDAPTQISFYSAAGYYHYEFVNPTVSQASALVYKPKVTPTPATNAAFTVEKQSLSAWLDNLEVMINAVIEDEDMNIMSGDILKAYGDKIYVIAMLTTQEEQTFTYDVNLLQQFKNTIYLDVPADNISSTLEFITKDGNGNEITSSTPIIAQSGGVLTCKAVMTSKLTSAWGSFPISIAYEALRTTIPVSCVHEPTPEELLEWTRNIMVVDATSSEISAGTEIFLGLYLSIPKTTLNIPKDSTLNQGDYIVQYATHENVAAVRPLVKKVIPNTSSNKVSVSLHPAYSNTAINPNYCGYTNTAWASAFIQGLDYGPATNYYECNQKVTASLDAGRLNIDATPLAGNVKTNNALLSKSNVQAMHDLAISALLYSAFIKG